MFSVKGVDTSGFSSGDSLYAQIEFDGGLLTDEVDRRLVGYSNHLLTKTGILNVETGARTGSGSILISFDPKKIKPYQVRDFAKQIYIPGGFVFFHENSLRDRYWEIFIYGDEDQKCRELAQELAYISSDHPLIKDRVLNFKQGSKKLVLLPNREQFAESNIGFTAAASRARLGVYGPVSYKRIDSNGEIDVRIRTADLTQLNNFYMENIVTRQFRDETLDILVPVGNTEVNSSIQLRSLMNLREETEPSNIRRDNRRRFASITIVTKPMDPRHVKREIAPLFNQLSLPPGYSIEFDPEAIRKSKNLSTTVFSLVLAIVFCYMILASINESFTIPLLILSVIPPSLSIPAICLVLSGSLYNSAIACAFIAVSGMTINAAVLCVDSIRTSMQNGSLKTFTTVYFSIRRIIPALLATTGTTVVGAIPFIFLSEGTNSIIRTFSLVGALGITFSFFCSITIIPSLIFISKKGVIYEN
jgi:multidrug efflux pump subunit AcrB